MVPLRLMETLERNRSEKNRMWLEVGAWALDQDWHRERDWSYSSIQGKQRKQQAYMVPSLEYTSEGKGEAVVTLQVGYSPQPPRNCMVMEGSVTHSALSPLSSS